MIRLRVLLTAVLFATAAGLPLAQSAAQVPSADQQLYEKFHAWFMSHADAKGDIDALYRAELKQQGLSPAEIDRQMKVIEETGNRLEAARWNRILTSPAPAFNTKPNTFLVDMIRGLKPGAALDVGMGQGRNAIYLAQQGWAVTGFDPADQAVAAAQKEAARLGVTLTALVQRDDQFEFKKNAWDLVVLSYVGAREYVDRVFDALKPGGLVVIEAFHRDATKAGPIGPMVVFDTNELLHLFDRFRVIRYEDTEAVADFGLEKLRVVRMCAQKPPAP